MEQAADILKHVETPLQLAAVALLVIYGITKALIATKRWTPSDAIVTQVVNRAFVLGLLSLLLAVGGPLLVHAVDRDDLIAGSVYGPDNMAIRNATVSAPPIGAQPVHYDGSFELRVPDHTKRPAYDVTASADGFKSETRTVGKSQLGAVDFKLLAQPEHAIRQIFPELVVGQYFGLPIVIVAMQVKSPGTTQSFITEMSAQLSHGSMTISLFPQVGTTASQMGPYQGVGGSVPIAPNLQQTFRFLLMPNANFTQMYRAIGALPDANGRPPCMPSNNGFPAPLSDEAFDIVRSFAKTKFVWAAGAWKLHFAITAGDQHDVFDKSFELSDDDVDTLWRSTALLKSCLASFSQTPLAQDGAIANYLLR